ncbi:MAG: hypothetical protein NC355_04970 [Blautia sp.]|nr:hypothetical protein [Blautia sp.]
MVIQTPRETYHVIEVQKNEKELRVYLARAEGREGLYRLLEYTDRRLAEQMLTCFPELDKEAVRPPDFVECFAKDGFWAVFRYYALPPFLEQADAGVEERILLWRALLEEIIFRGLPLCLQWAAAEPSLWVADESLAVHVNHMPAGNRGELPALQRRLADAFSVFFAGELQAENHAALEYRRELAEAAFADAPAVYQAFREQEEGLRRPGEMKKKRRLLQWDILFSHAGQIVKALYWLIVVLLWGLFVWVLRRPPEMAEYALTRIGTLEIRGYESVDMETEAPGAGEASGTEDTVTGGERLCMEGTEN